MHINPAEDGHDGNHDHDDEREHLVERVEVEESAQKHRQGGHRTRHHLGEELDDAVDIHLQPVDDITRMPFLLAVPFRAEDAVEQALLHAVLGTHAQDVADPCAGDAQCEVAQHEQCHESHSPVDGTGFHMRCDVDGVLYGPDRTQTHHHREQTDGRIEHGLETVAPPGIPEPPHDLGGGILALRRRQVFFYLLEHKLYLLEQ